MNTLRILLATALVGGSLGAAAHGDHAPAKKTAAPVKDQMDWGIAGDAPTVTRTIRVRMTDDMRFSPDTIEVKQGETVKFVVHNSGRMLHEMVIGTKKMLDEHAAMMKKFPGMEHDEPYMVHVKPGRTASMVWTFNRPGEFQFACLIAGHYEAGMVGRIRVAGDMAPLADGKANGNGNGNGKITAPDKGHKS